MKILEKGKLNGTLRFESGVETKCLFPGMPLSPPCSPHTHMVPNSAVRAGDRVNTLFSVEENWGASKSAGVRGKTGVSA